METRADVTVQADGADLSGDLVVPERARGIVLFAHGSGSSRHSPRNQFVASVLQRGGFGTLLIDLLTMEEEAIDMRTGRLRFDIDRLASRLVDATDWLGVEPATSALQTGYFGASTGAAAAIVAAAIRPERVHAVVSRGGRPDLAGDALSRVTAPTLLIVGSDDVTVLDLNQQALEELRCVKELSIVSGASHLFEERGALEQVAELALGFYAKHLGARGRDARRPHESLRIRRAG
jgi:pimeloyl-ACP methyl ester carboxylesterase